MTADGVCPRAPRRLIDPAIFPSAPLAYVPYAYHEPCTSCDLSFSIWLLSFLFCHTSLPSIFNMIGDSGILLYLAYAYFIRHAVRGIPPTPIHYHSDLNIRCALSGSTPFPTMFLLFPCNDFILFVSGINIMCIP